MTTTTPANPFLFPTETRSLYLYMNCISICVILFCGSLLTLGPQLELLLWFLLDGVFLLVWVGVSISRYRRSLPLSPEIRAALDERLTLKATGTSFRVAHTSDFLAWEALGKRCVFIPVGAVEQLEAETRDPSTPPGYYTALVAHEIGHLITKDSKVLRRTVLLAVSAFLGGVCLAIAIWPAAWVQRVRLILGFSLILALFAALLYRTLRVREFYADAAAGYLVGRDAIKEVLAGLRAAERYLTRSWWHRLTHPTFDARSQAFDAFSSMIDYSHGKAITTGLLAGFVAVAFAMGGNAMIKGGSFFLMVIIAPFGLYLGLRVIGGAVITPALMDKLDSKKCLIRAFEVWLFLFAGLGLAIYLFAGRNGLARVGFSALDLPLWQTYARYLLGIIVMHFVFWLGVRQYLRYRCPKYPTRLFTRRATIWLGLVATQVGIAAQVALFDLPATLLGRDGDWLVKAAASALLVLAVGTLAALGVSGWLLMVRQDSRRWGAAGPVTAALFVDSEWSAPGILIAPHGSAQPGVRSGAARLAIWATVGCVILPLAGVAIVGITFLVGVSELASKLVPMITSPEVRTRIAHEALGVSDLPRGLYAESALQLGSIGTLLVLTDRPAGEGGLGGGFENSLLIYIDKVQDAGTDSRVFAPFFRGESNESVFLKAYGITVTLDERLTQRDFKVNDQEVASSSYCGTVLYSGQQLAGAVTVALIECRTDERTRGVMWATRSQECCADGSRKPSAMVQADFVNLLGAMRVCSE